MIRRPPRATAPDGPDVLAIVLGVAGVLAGAAAVVGELALRQSTVIVPVPIAVINSSLAWILMACAIVRAAAIRGPREVAPLRQGIRRIAVGIAILYPSLALVPILQQWVGTDAAFLVDGVSTVVSLPIIIVGTVGLCWPPGMSRTQWRVLVADALVGTLGLIVLWLVVVFPATRHSHPIDTSWAQANAVAMLLVAVLLVVIMTAARRRALIPARQAVLLHGAVALHLAAGLLDLLFPVTGVTSVKVFYFGSVLGGAAFLAFLLGQTGATESPRESRLRELYAASAPLLPIPLASLALVVVLVAEDGEPGAVEILGAVLLILLLISVVVLRALAASELRGAARERADTYLASSTEEVWFQVLVGRTRDLTLVLHRNGRIAYATPSVHRATGLSAQDLRGRVFASLLSPNPAHGAAVRSLIEEADRLTGEPTEPQDLLLRGADGTVHEVEWRFTALVGLDIDGYLVHGTDVTDERRMRALLAESASRDTLTGLHNRNGFIHGTAERAGRRCVLVINLRRFGEYNDRHGHSAGDTVLQEVAEILGELPGPVSDPARLSADTFAVLVGGTVPDIEVVSATASIREALRLMALPDRPQPLELPLDVAAGYAVSESDDMPVSELLSRAELAMAQSRVMDRSPLVKFDPGLRVVRAAAAVAEADLRSALRERTLVVRYQPIVRLSDGAVVGAEALVRRLRADGSLEPPDVFIPLAERLGLVDEVDYAVLMRALGEMQEVAAKTGRRLPVSVNVSASELDDGLEHRVRDALAETGWRAGDLIIEVTETALATRTEEAARLLRRLQQIGCLVAMDDFGTGYSSMASLVEMPVDIVKIDASFTQRLTAAGRGLAIMRAIVEIGHSLNLVTVAEGLATVEQADLLRGMGCDRGQGYLYAPALTVEDLIDYLRPDTTMLPVD